QTYALPVQNLVTFHVSICLRTPRALDMIALFLFPLVFRFTRDFREQRGPHPPRQYDHGVGVIPAQEQHVVVSEPCFQLGETGTALARLRFSDDRRFTTAEGIKIEIVSAAAEAAGATQRIAFCMHADGFVAFDQFTLATISLA